MRAHAADRSSVPLDSIAAVQQRIRAIESRMGVQPKGPVFLGVASTPSTAGTVAMGTGLPPTGDFDALLTQSMGSDGLTPAVKLRPGAYGKLTPPPELVAYGNGRIPPEALESIGVGEHRLYAPAARGFRELTADARVAGVDIGITWSYRSFDEQVRIAESRGIYGKGGWAAVPGTSHHGWGLSLDLELDGRAQAWMRENAHRYGFVEDVPREPWHWTYRPA